MKRYPLQPLLEAMGLEGATVSRSELATRLGMDPKALDRARRYGFIERTADLYACRNGFVPWVVWPEWLDHVIESEQVECADEKCDRLFVPARKGHRFCSRTCQARANKRLRYATDPVVAERIREAQRRYYAECAAATQARVRAWRAANLERVLERQREWYRANAEDQKAKNRARYHANKEKQRAAARERYAANRELFKERNRAYYEANREALLEKQRERDRAKRVAA